ncbi:peptidase C45 [Streptosporangiaceae bacterium NEAU-GS5]|nr:peptidase C45 [Streptosporangiaceae bacterium NEAU-GS5]
MIRAYTSTVNDPFDRGHEFGRIHATKVARTVEVYRDVFAYHAGHEVDLADPGGRALKAIKGWAPDLGAEIEGIAEGARLPVTDIAAINARTEILAAVGAGGLSECSAVVLLGDDKAAEGPVAMQTWDWLREMDEGWFVWTIPHADGRVTQTLTEYGVVGKIGVNAHGLGVLFTMLHHDRDGQEGIGLPVHVAARRVMDECSSVHAGAYLLATAPVSASSSVTMVEGGPEGRSAISAELHPDGPGWKVPDDDGILVHTNHFLDPRAVPQDSYPRQHPGTLIRRDMLRRGLRPHAERPTADAVRTVMARHASGVCHHPADVGERDHVTLATVELDLPGRQIKASVGAPCGQP